MAQLFTKNQDRDTAERIQAAYANAQDATQNTFTKAKGRTQDKLADTRDSAQSTFETARDVTQDRLAKVQDSTKVGLDKAKHLLSTLVGIVIALFYENQRKAQRKLKQAQASVLKTATPIAEKTQDVVVTSTKKASQSLQKAADNAKDAKESLQDWYAHYQQKRRRNRMLFRIGLLAGVAVALFYTPLAGSDVRQRITQQWQHYRSYFGR